MSDVLKQQVDFAPEAQNAERMTTSTTEADFVVCGGMGGSALPALILRFLGISPYVVVHRDYGLPTHLPPQARYVAISYSGDTEESLSFAHEAIEKNLPLSVVASGGALLDLAKEKGLPYVQVPTGPEPRDSIVATTKALLALLCEGNLLGEFSEDSFDTAAAELGAESLTNALVDSTPIFYSSTRNEILSYIGKIQCNETGKIPAFSNVFPEMNHNEMQGFGSNPHNQALTKPLVAVFLRDSSDNARVQRRMELTETLLREQGLRTISISLPSENRVQTFLYGWWLLRATARSLATQYGVEPDGTPLVKEFKSKL